MMLIKTPADREREKKERIKSSWAVIRGSSDKIAQKFDQLKIDFGAINRKRKAWAEKHLKKKNGG